MMRQTNLFTAGGHAWRETVLKRLPSCDFIGVLDLALAFGISQSKAMEWIHEGRIEAVNLNAGIPGRKAWYRIPRKAVLELIDRIEQGL